MEVFRNNNYRANWQVGRLAVIKSSQNTFSIRNRASEAEIPIDIMLKGEHGAHVGIIEHWLRLLNAQRVVTSCPWPCG